MLTRRRCGATSRAACTSLLLLACLPPVASWSPPPSAWLQAPPPPFATGVNCSSQLASWGVIDPTATASFEPVYAAAYDYRRVPLADLQILSGCAGSCPSSVLGVNTYQCNYIPDGIFEDTFGGPSLDLYAWQPAGSFAYNFSNTYDGTAQSENPAYTATGVFSYKFSSVLTTPWGYQTAGVVLDHCPSAGAVGAASAATCTALMPANLQTGVDLSAVGYSPMPGAADQSVLGATMTLTQAACIDSLGVNNPACCTVSVNARSGLSSTACASWAGSHLASQFCAQYGVVEAEAAFEMPAEGGAYFFFGSFVMGANNDALPGFGSGAPVTADQAWNEARFQHGSLRLSDSFLAGR